MTLETEFQNRAYVPGDSLRGTADWVSESLRAEGEMSVRLFYYADRAGGPEVHWVDERSFPMSAGAGEFTFELPVAGPFSFAGKYFDLKWALELVPPQGKARTQRLEFTYSPSGMPVDVYAHHTEDMPVVKAGIQLGKGLG